MEAPEQILSLTTQLKTDGLALWSEDKKKEFVDTFSKRSKAARFILLWTATLVRDRAREKHFISEKHVRQLAATHGSDMGSFQELLDDKVSYFNVYSADNHTIGGRPIRELKKIAEERAAGIIDSLPALSKAVRIISPEIAEKIEKKNGLIKKGQEVLNQAEEVSGALDMKDLDQDMTIGAFREMVLKRETRRKQLLAKLDEIGKQGQELQSQIDKFLFNGIPELSNAVLKVIREYVEKSIAYGATDRRVSEQVQFGDSDLAIDILSGFEHDEVTVSSEIKASFAQALENLKLAAKKPARKSRKAITAGK